MFFLNHSQIKLNLAAQGLKSPYDMQILPSVSSTNCFLKKMPLGQPLAICCAEQQTHGRGRFGRLWDSPFGEHIYCSSRWQLAGDLAQFPGLSLVCALAVSATIKEFTRPNPDIKIKWPNDILWKDKKLSGILIELMTLPENQHAVIIGIGLNVNPTHNSSDSLWSSLNDIQPAYYNRNLLIARLLINIEKYLAKLASSNLQEFMPEWNSYDYLAGKYITLNQANTTISGKARGVDHIGRLILENEEGILLHLSSGDTTVQKF